MLTVRLTAFAVIVALLAPTSTVAASPKPVSSRHMLRMFTGMIAGEKVHLTLELRGSRATGSYFALTSNPAKMTVNDVEGSLYKSRLTLYVDDPDLPNPVAKINATVNESNEITGTWTSTKTGSSPLKVSLAEDALGRAAHVDIGDGAIAIKNKKPHYDITVAYPRLQGAAYAWVNARLRQIAYRQARDFAKLSKEIDADGPVSNEPNWLDSRYEIDEFTPSFLSVRFIESTFTGGVHPNSNSMTYNFDLADNRELKLGDLYPSGASYLRPLALSAIAALSADQEADYSMIIAGASTSPANYRSWNLTRCGLIISFDPYQVGPYAAGPQQVYYPLTAIGQLRPEAFAMLSAIKHP